MNDEARERIRLDVKKFLDEGGRIQHCDHTHNRSHGEPVKKTMLEQRDHFRRLHNRVADKLVKK